MEEYSTYYSDISKPWFAPEPWVFGFAWGIIYPLIIAAALYTIYLWYQDRLPQVHLVLTIFVSNIIANLAFTPLQLGWPTEIYATLDIVLVLLTLVYLQRYFWQNNKIIFLLLLPYLLWGGFATVLQVTIYCTNFL